MGSAPCGHEYSSCRAGGCRCEQPPLLQARTPGGLQTRPWQAVPPTVWQRALSSSTRGQFPRFTAYTSHFRPSEHLG